METTTARPAQSRRGHEPETREFTTTLDIYGQTFTVAVEYEYDRDALRHHEEPIQVNSVALVTYYRDGRQIPVSDISFDAGELPSSDYDKLLFAAHVDWMRS